MWKFFLKVCSKFFPRGGKEYAFKKPELSKPDCFQGDKIKYWRTSFESGSYLNIL